MTEKDIAMIFTFFPCLRRKKLHVRRRFAVWIKLFKKRNYIELYYNVGEGGA